MKIPYIIDNVITPNIVNLPFIDRYAGVVRTINFAVEDQANKTQIKRFPVACNIVSPDCANPTQTPTYDDLVPDDSKRSVLYWEVVQPMRDAGITETGKFYERKQRGVVRLVGWLNLGALGFTGCNDGIEIVTKLENEIVVKGKFETGIYEDSLFWIKPLGEVEQDINKIFGKYDYPKLKNFYLYPFNFFALDFEVLLYQCFRRGATVPVNTPIDCVNQIS